MTQIDGLVTERSPSTPGRFLLSGAVAGAASATAFVALHQLVVSNIWFSVIPMAAAGAICGVALAGTYRLLFDPPSVSTWLVFNAVFVVLLAGLGVTSLLVFEPITTIPVLLAAKKPPRELFGRAMPVTIAFTLGSAALISLWRGRSLVKAGSVLLTCTLIVLLLGLNVSVLGLVQLTSSSAHLVAELFGFILALAGVYAAGVLLLERSALFRAPGARRHT